jgi:hypothetical protein
VYACPILLAVPIPSPELEGVRLKLFWACDHFRDLDVAIGDLFAKQSKAVRHEVKDQNELIVTWPNEPPLEPRYALLLGDCIHNVRSALDHLVAQLAILNNAPSTAIEKTSFPVCLSRDDFKNVTVRRVAPFISSLALAEIEKLQPYSTCDGTQDILWVLSQLDIIDKHRLLIVAKHKMRARAFKISTEDGQELAVTIPPNNPWKPSENGAEIIRFRIAGLQRYTKMRVQLTAEGTVQIEQTGLVCDGQNPLVLLGECIVYVSSIVERFGKMFFRE